MPKQTNFERFSDLTKKLLSVPNEEIRRREEQEKEGKKKSAPARKGKGGESSAP